MKNINQEFSKDPVYLISISDDEITGKRRSLEVEELSINKDSIYL